MVGDLVRRICCLFDNNLLSILMEVKVYLLGILWKRKFTSKKSFLWKDEKVLKYFFRSKKKTRITIIKKLFLLRPFTKELFARKKKFQAERGDCFLWPSFLHRREAEVLGFPTMPWSCFLLQNKGSHLQQAYSFFEEAEFRLDWTSFLDLCDRKILGVAKISFSCSQL